MSNYGATVVKINSIRKHSNADRLMCTSIFGNNVIVGLDTKEGDFGLFFPLESQLGKDFAIHNDFIRRKDSEGKNAGGMFDDNRRVRTQKFRGERSMGFFCPLDSLHNLIDPEILNALVEGDSFEELDGVAISTKYINKRISTQERKAKKGKAAKQSKVIDGQFHFHFDTAQLGRNIHKLKPDDLISLTWKMHGTSGVASNALCNKQLKWYEKALRAMGINIIDTEYSELYSSRRVIKNEFVEAKYINAKQHFYNENIWMEAGKRFKGMLRKGESIYFEIVGYTSAGGFIQKGFDYKVPPYSFDIYIYRVTQTTLDGQVLELPWHQVEHRALELCSKTVPSIFYGPAQEFFPFTQKEWFNTEELSGWHEGLLKKIIDEYVYDQDSIFCDNIVPEEGVVLRVEGGNGITNYKCKSYRFYEYETKLIDSGEEDIEESEE